jgi:hypothetical protein
MALLGDILKTKNKINSIYERRRAALYALSLSYAAQALNNFRRDQANNDYWTNQTSIAFNSVFADAFIDRNVVGWFLAHGVEYGVYLELSNDGQNAGIRLNVEALAQDFLDDVNKLYGG